MSSKSLLKYFAAVAFIFCTANLSAQVENSVVLQDIVEEIAENTDDELDYTTLFNNLEILAEKVKAGVDVRVMYDGMCEMSVLPKNYPELMAGLGIQCKPF
ncbi:MAG: hypothetical protein II604_04910, partial [Bacteroidales bacterium]|nr:hypothetical protein [Bacteroidales bacterium]